MSHEQSHALMPMMPGDVRDYLLAHPDFLVNNADLLASLVPPTPRRGERVQDFQGYMLERLQENLSAIKNEHDDLMSLMQEQMQRQGRMNSAALCLLDAPDFESTLTLITKDMAPSLDHVAVSLFIEEGGVLQPGVYGGLHVVPEGFVRRWLRGHDIILEEKQVAAPELFGDKAPEVKSEALIKLVLGEEMPLGLLALGHADPMYYATGLATEQVEFLGAIVERCLARWLV